MKTKVPALKPGDIIGITAPAKAIEKYLVDEARKKLESLGFRVIVSKNCSNRHHYFSGTIEERTRDFQEMLENPDVKAIVCARGGYGCIQIVDLLNWAPFIRSPKWIIGFSDVTVLHQHVNKLGFESIHGTMPLNYSENTENAFSTLVKAIGNESYTIEVPSTIDNKPGDVSGRLIGGNLSILHSLLGTDDQVDYSDTILFIEDICEQLYNIDRIFHALRKAGILEQIKGLVVGGMTNLQDTKVPFGMNYKEIIRSHFRYKKTVICFDFPAGHIDDNRAIVLGREVRLEVDASSSRLYF